MKTLVSNIGRKTKQEVILSQQKAGHRDNFLPQAQDSVLSFHMQSIT